LGPILCPIVGPETHRDSIDAAFARYDDIKLGIMLAAAIVVLLVHLVWIAFVIFGALWTRGRPTWSALHILALLWGIAVEAGPWPCPLTLAEQYFESRAGRAAYHGSFLLHLLDATIYPNLPDWAITIAGVAVCAFNLAIYGWRFRNAMRRRASHS
jgi:Protein of Unknown function (DUF2784)